MIDHQDTGGTGDPSNSSDSRLRPARLRLKLRPVDASWPDPCRDQEPGVRPSDLASALLRCAAADGCAPDFESGDILGTLERRSAPSWHSVTRLTFPERD